MVTFYDLKAAMPQGKTFDFAQLKDKVVLIVNTASKCGFTPQFEGLEKLHKTYSPRGFTVLGFPCNQFMSQDPGNDESIGSFCLLNYGVSFPIMAKSDVNGDNANEVFKFLKHAKPGLLGSEMIKWNFTKFLVDRQGNVVERYAPTTDPKNIAQDIEKYL
ncbi:glutathione peroxidase [Malassezia arunalokei]|uniref:Glutathione peroxidase n=1 Tax=Malassezia arunalokei TaxID=1514897 RepID=A0AAJ5YZH7_9BASI|nr:glutathione peroxidase [Malassezia arunalokei]